MLKRIVIALVVMPNIAFASGDYILPTAYALIAALIFALCWIFQIKWKLFGKAILILVFFIGIVVSGLITSKFPISYYHYLIPGIYFFLPLLLILLFYRIFQGKFSKATKPIQ